MHSLLFPAPLDFRSLIVVVGSRSFIALLPLSEVTITISHLLDDLIDVAFFTRRDTELQKEGKRNIRMCKSHS